MSLFDNPVLEAVKGLENILIAGCGGGYDVFSGLPIYFALKKLGKKVHLSNFSFTSDLQEMTGSFVTNDCLTVTADTQYKNPSHKITKLETYFPEYYLSQWFREVEHEEVPIYTIKQTIGVVQLTEIYQTLVQTLGIEAIILADGGTDSLMRGDEIGLGTPVEDSMNLVSVGSLVMNHENSNTTLKVCLLACIGFGVDSFHGVNHSLYLQNVASLIKDYKKKPQLDGNSSQSSVDQNNNNRNNEDDHSNRYKEVGFRGCFAVLPFMEEAVKFISAYEACRPYDSIVTSSIMSAIGGNFGDYHNPHTVMRTRSSNLYISPLMNMYWVFDLRAVVKELKYKDFIMQTKRIDEVMSIIHSFHKKIVNGKSSIQLREGGIIPY